MKFKRIIVVTVLFMGLVASIVLMTSASSKVYIPIICKGLQHQFWQAVKMGADQAAKEFNVEIGFDGPEGESQVDKQIEMVKAALNKKPSALCLAALDSKALVPLLEKAKSMKIPVIGFDSGVDSNIPVTTCSTKNVEAASLAADKMAALIGGQGEVALVVQDQTSRSGIDRRDGFVNRLKDKYPKIKVVGIQYGAGDHQKSQSLAKAMMQAYPKLKGIFGANEGSAIGVLNAVKELKKTGKIVIVGFDSGKLQKEAIRSGLMAGAITQNPVGIGYEAIKAAVKAIRGETVPKEIDTGFYWYDKTNIDDPKIKPNLYD